MTSFTLKEFENNFKQLKNVYETFKNTPDNELDWPEGWVKRYKKNVHYIKRKDLDLLYLLTKQRFEEALKKWFDAQGTVKEKFRSVLINFYGSMLWLYQLIVKVAKINIEELNRSDSKSVV